MFSYTLISILCSCCLSLKFFLTFPFWSSSYFSEKITDLQICSCCLSTLLHQSQVAYISPDIFFFVNNITNEAFHFHPGHFLLALACWRLSAFWHYLYKLETLFWFIFYLISYHSPYTLIKPWAYPCCFLNMLSISQNQGLWVLWTLNLKCTLPRYLQDLSPTSFISLPNFLLITEAIPVPLLKQQTHTHPCVYYLPFILHYFSSWWLSSSDLKKIFFGYCLSCLTKK